MRGGDWFYHGGDIAAVFAMDGITTIGMFTHLAADDTDVGRGREFTKRQAGRFRKIAEKLKTLGYVPKLHLQSSLGVMNYPEPAADYARTGLALYGYAPARLADTIPNEIISRLGIRVKKIYLP